MAGYDIAIVGATGMVGSATLSILEEREFPINHLYLIASERSVGETLEFKGKAYLIENINHFDFTKAQLAFFCAGGEVSAKYAPEATKAGTIVIDKSSYFRYDPEVPLVIPEVNGNALHDLHKKNIVANPNCSTIPVVMTLKSIYDAVGIARINIATYQSVSGSGKNGVKELVEQTGQLLNGRPIKAKTYPQQIAFNILPHIDEFQENGYTKEEMKIVWETQKILNDDTIAINPTAARVPVFYGHSAAVHVETRDPIELNDVIALLKKSPGIKVVQGKYPYPTAVHDAAGKDSVYVGRIRKDISHPNGLDFWIVADNIRKGAALNAVQVAEKIIKSYL